MMGVQDMKYKISKEFFPLYYFTAPALPPKVAGFLGSMLRPLPWIFIDKDVDVKTEIIEGYDQGRIKLYVMSPKNKKDNSPCIVYFHGGGFTYGAVAHHYSLCKQYAMQAGCTVILADYRLSSKFQFPIPVEDCYAAYEWTLKNSERIGIDVSRVAVAGDSAGGALAAAVSIMARDRGAKKPVFQMLIYPVTDRRMITDSMNDFVDTPMWNAKLNAKMWEAYLGGSLPSKIEYASPAEAESTSGLPDAYIETAEFDCLRDEGILYGKRLEESGGRVIFNYTVGTFHAFDAMRSANTTKQAISRRIAYINDKFENNVRQF